jgi:hypothetical protein
MFWITFWIQLEKSYCSCLKIANQGLRNLTSYIDRDSYTTPLQLQRLEHGGIIYVLRLEKADQFYWLNNKSRIIRMVSKYKITL